MSLDFRLSDYSLQDKQRNKGVEAWMETRTKPLLAENQKTRLTGRE